MALSLSVKSNLSFKMTQLDGLQRRPTCRDNLRQGGSYREVTSERADDGQCKVFYVTVLQCVQVSTRFLTFL